MMKVLLSLFLCAFISLASAKPVNKIVIFGDSLSDNGNLYEYTQHKVPPSPPYFKGRFSNGPVWVEQLINMYFPTKSTSNYLADYAFGGAGVEEEQHDNLFILSQEVETYFIANQGKADPNSLYFIWIGANNYLGGPSDIEQEINKVNEGIVKQLKRLVAAGAKQVAVVNLPNLGKTPLARALNNEDKLNLVSIHHNNLLKEKINELQANYPSIQWLYFDVNQVFENAITHPAVYGFTNVTQACYKNMIMGSEEVPSQPVLAYAANIPKSKLTNCTGYLFFDFIHPTSEAHHLVALAAKDLLTSAGITLE